MTTVADGPSGAAGNAECARKLVERLESSKLGGLRKLPDFGRLPRLDFRWAHNSRLSFVLYLSLEASIRTVDTELSKNTRCFSNMRRLPSSASSSDSAISEPWPVSSACLTITRWRASWTVNSAICRLACERYF